jgi:hypothetical protein
MTQILPAALVAPTRAGQSVGYQIRAVNGDIATAFTTTKVTEEGTTGYYWVDDGITAPDDGGTLEWYISNAGVKTTFLSAVAIEPAPNQADQAAGIRAALGLASANVDTQLSGLATQASVDTKASQASVDALPNAGTIADTVWDELLSGHTNTGTTGKKLADTSTLTAGDIPAGLTAQQVWTYAAGDRALTGAQATNLANISNIPTNPLLTNDARLNNLDTTISSRSTLTAAQIRTELATELARLDVAVSTRLATAGYTTPPTTSQIAAAVEAALLNDADGQKLLEAIKDTVQALFDAQADVPVSTLVGLIADRITTDHGSGSYTTANVSALALEATAQAIRAKTDNLPASPAAVGDVPTTTQIWTHATRALTDKDNFGLADNAIDADTLATSAVTEIQNGLATAASISTPAQIASQVRTELATELARINVDLSTRLAAADYVAPSNTAVLAAIELLPTEAEITNAVWNATLTNYTGPGSTGAKLGLASTLTVGDIPAGLTAQQVWEYATRTLTTASGLTTEQNTKLNELWRKAQLDNANPVTRDRNLSTGAVTETLGQTGIQIVHAVTNDGNTVTSTRQP